MRIISHIINIIVASFIATVFMFPISTSDVYFVATLGSHLVWLTIPIMVIVDTITAMGAYKLSYWLVPKIVNRKLKPKEKIAINIIIHLVWFGACIVGAAMFDVFCGVAVCYVGYLMYYLLARLYVHKVNSVDVDNDEKRMIRIGEKVGKWGWWLVFIAALTPFPYTLTIYAVGSVNWGNSKKVGSAVFIGKLIKYIAVYLTIHYGIKIF